MELSKKYLVENMLERVDESQFLLNYVDGKKHYITDIMTDFANQSKWIRTKDELPEEGEEVIGFSEKWIHPDFNLEGTRVCFINMGEWISAKWNNDQDSWHTHAEWCCGDNGGVDFAPTHWQHKPKKPSPVQKTTPIANLLLANVASIEEIEEVAKQYFENKYPLMNLTNDEDKSEIDWCDMIQFVQHVLSNHCR